MRSILLALLLATPAFAAPGLPTVGERYVRFRAAEAAGDMSIASDQMAALLSGGGSSDVLAQRAYRQGIAGGNHDLAVKAARILQAQDKLPVDGPLLFAIDAIRAKDWKTARAELDKLEAGRLFSFIAPLVRVWITVEARDGDALAQLEATRSAGLASTYYPAEHVLVLAALGHLDDAANELRAQQAAGSRLKLVVAAAFVKAKRIAEAKALLTGDEQPLIEARARLDAGKSIGIEPDGALGGISELLTQIAVDFNRQRLMPVAMVMARLATFTDPGNSSAWIATASLLGIDKKQRAGIEALSHIKPDDPFAEDAKSMRVSLLIDADDKPAALEQAVAATKGSNVEAGDWSRAGDVYLALERYKEAADAYSKAVQMSGAAPADRMWPLLLQQGTALEFAGDWPGAKTALTRAAQLAPTQPVVLNHLGYSLLSRREEIPRATQLINEASRIRPDDPAIIDSSGWAHFVGGDIKGALPLLETAAAGDPADPTINEHLGDVYWTAGRRVEARYAWKAAESGAEQKDLGRLRTKIADGLTKATAAP